MKTLTVTILLLGCFTLAGFSQDCSKIIEKKIDKFTNEISFSTPLAYIIDYEAYSKLRDKYYKNKDTMLLYLNLSAENKVRYIKTVNNTDTSCYLFLKSMGVSLNAGIKGVTILLSDGAKIEFPEGEVNCKYRSGRTRPANESQYDYDYSAMVRLSKEQIEKLKNNFITDYRLYIYDTEVKQVEKERYSQYLKCLIQTKL